MMIKRILIFTFFLASIAASSQFYSLSGSYSPTFDSYNFGLGINTDVFLMDYQVGVSDQFFSLGMDLSFRVADNSVTSDRSAALMGFYLGLGGELLLMDDSDRDMGNALYLLATFSYNTVALSYGYGYYDYDGTPSGGLDGYHKLKLTLFLTEVETRSLR